ncbi:MAG TPA: hypothetical protein VFO14_25775 [Vicinamibacterales bacterium]|nr:hypothetical protein [Vicinamibacterales bacterium]
MNSSKSLAVDIVSARPGGAFFHAAKREISQTSGLVRRVDDRDRRV